MSNYFSFRGKVYVGARDESGNPDYDPHDTRVRLPHDGLTEAELAALSGAVRVTKGSV